jgi:class 3 adenylate cyclase/tetratricopeptide (TPR) repeat protein
MTAAPVTLLFTDLVDSTGLLQRVGDERAQHVLRAHRQLLREALASHGGREVKWLGDGLLTTFASVADGVRCAVTMAQRARRPVAGERLGLRLGLHVGEVLADEADYVGTPVVLARRLCDRARAGQILCSRVVVELLRGRKGFAFADVGPVELKGFAEPVAAYEVGYRPDAGAALLPHTPFTGRTAPESSPLTDLPFGHLPFVGRVEELKLLAATLDQALAGRGQIVLLVGEPGIGKSRTAEEIAGRAARLGAEVLAGRCWEEEGAPAFWPWVEVIRAYVRARDDAELTAALGVEGGDLVQLVREIRERLPALQATPSRDGESARFRLFDSMATVLLRAARMRPMLIVLEDLHGADRASLLFLRFLARGLRDAGLLVVGTFRDMALTREHPIAETLGELVREPASCTVPLRGLSAAEVASLIETSTGVSPPPQLVAKLRDRTGGNPLFLTEAVRSLAGRGPADAWASAPDLTIPAGVRAAVLGRLENLSGACADALRLASGLGREFREDVLARASALPPEQLTALVVEALEASLLEAPPDRSGWLRFAHALLRDVVYEEVAVPLRRELHLRLACAMEEVTSAEIEPPLAELAAHFLAAGDARAVGYARRAGDRTLALLAYEEAARLYGTALQALDRTMSRDDATRCDLLLALGHALNQASDAAGSRDAVLQAAESARRRGAREQLSRAALGLGSQSLWGETGYVDAMQVALLEEAIATWGDEDAALHVELLARLAATLYLSAEALGRRTELAAGAVAMARRLGDRESLTSALLAQHSAIWAAGNAGQRLAIADELVHLAEAVGDLRLAFEGHFCRFHDHLELGDGPALEAAFDACRRLSTDLREPYHAVHLVSLQATRALVAGRWQEAEGLVGALQDLGQRGWRRGAGDVIGSILLGCAAERGYVDLLITMSRGVLAQPTAVKPLLRCFIAGLCAAAGRTDEARAEYEALVPDGLSDLPSDCNLLLALCQLAETCRALDDERGAAVLYDALLPYAGLCITMPGYKSGFLGTASLYLGMLAAMLSRPEDAARHLEDALAVHARLGAAPWVARTQFEYATLLLAREGDDNHARARALLAEARATAATLGMRSLLLKVETLAERAGHDARSVGPPYALPVHDETPSSAYALGTFRREGDVWSITYADRAVRVRDTKGLAYIAHLLAHPGQEVHVADLVTLGGDTAAGEQRTPAGQDLGALLDPRARAEYKQRLHDLRDELEEATGAGDLGRAAALREEIEQLGEALRAAYGLGGRVRTTGDPAERMRKAVTIQIRRSLARVRAVHPALGRHLTNGLRTGVFCSYTPEQPVVWSL